jgi:HEPN domain-containing protein
VLRLVEQVERAGIRVPGKIADAAKELERHYIPSRYPDAYPSGSPYEFYREQDAQVAIDHTEAVLRFVRETWEDVEHP